MKEKLRPLYWVSQELGHLWAQLPWEDYESALQGVNDPLEALGIVDGLVEPIYDPDFPGITPGYDSQAGAFFIPAGRGGVVKAYIERPLLEVSYQKGEVLRPPLDAKEVWLRIQIALRGEEYPRIEAVEDRGARPRDYARVAAILCEGLRGWNMDLRDLVATRWWRWGPEMEEYLKYWDLYLNCGLWAVFMSPERAFPPNIGGEEEEIEA